MNSSGVTVLEPLEDRWEPLDTNDRVEGDFGMGFALDVFRSFSIFSAFCFLVGESPLLNAKVLLRGRSRLVEFAEVVGSNRTFSSIEPSWDFADRVRGGLVLLIVSSTEEYDDPVRDIDCGVSSLWVRTKSALTSSFNVRIWARWCTGMFLDS